MVQFIFTAMYLEHSLTYRLEASITSNFDVRDQILTSDFDVECQISLQMSPFGLRMSYFSAPRPLINP